MKDTETIIEFKFTDYRVFPLVMREENICREFLELILGKRIGELRIYPPIGARNKKGEEDAEANHDSWQETLQNKLFQIEGEKTILEAPHLRGVRLDVYAIDEATWYNIEMQCQVELFLPLRARYYQGQMDVFNLHSGGTFKDLKQSYVIFICTYDPFGAGLPIYRFENREISSKDLSLGDGTCKIFLNTTCDDAKVPTECRDFFRYVRDMQVSETNELVHAIHEKVVELNQPERRAMMYTLEDFLHDREDRKYHEGLAEGEEKGFAKGEAQGEEKGEAKKSNDIARKMLAKGLEPKLIAEMTGLTEKEIKAL